MAKTYPKLEAFFIEEVGDDLGAKGLQRLPELDAMDPAAFYILLASTPSAMVNHR
jgi:hypothetical protein